jgi:tellurite resistance protein TerC
MILWIGFIVLILLLLALDLGVLNKDHKTITAKQALGWTALWVSLAGLFSLVVYFGYMHNWAGINHAGISATDATVEYITGYLVEESLSMDNLFVISFLFRYFKVPVIHRHRVLFWGILGALIFRGLMIFAGAELVARFSWINYVFGGFLLYAGIKMVLPEKHDADPNKSFLVKMIRRVVTVDSDVESGKFFKKVNGRTVITSLFMVLIIVEFTDLMFAVDSIPAIFGITTDPFIVFTSNVFAILGLRSLFFAIESVIHRFSYLKYSLAIILVFVGVKLGIATWVHMSPLISLAVIVGLMGTGIAYSLYRNKN